MSVLAFRRMQLSDAGRLNQKRQKYHWSKIRMVFEIRQQCFLALYEGFMFLLRTQRRLSREKHPLDGVLQDS